MLHSCFAYLGCHITCFMFCDVFSHLVAERRVIVLMFKITITYKIVQVQVLKKRYFVLFGHAYYMYFTFLWVGVNIYFKSQVLMDSNVII